MNNMLCVEEPFNRERNLGNTADDFSFRGLHLELRRAFDLIADAKLDDCCEQFVFPKEEISEAKPFVKQAPRPAIIRSSSQQHTGRGGRNGGGRGGRNHFRNGNTSRRASSSNAYENGQNPAATAAALPHALLNPAGMATGDLQWPQMAPHYAYSDMAVLSNALSFAQHDQQRWHWYAQHQLQHAMAHAQRMQAGATQTVERSRTNSFDQGPPLTAPPRPEYYVWPTHLQPNLYSHQQQHPHAGYGTHPSSPSASTATTEFRRSLHRSNAANESGSSSSAGTLRSQSQPASRTSAPATNQNGQQAYGAANAPTSNGVAAYAQRPTNLSPFPAFVSDDRTDSEADEGSSRTLPDSPPEDDGSGYLGYFLADSTISPPKVVNNLNAMGDLRLSSSSRRRLSTEGPQSVLDRRLQRTSRSPSPLGHGRAISNGINPVVNGSAPLVVNGSTFMPTPTTTATAVPTNWPPLITAENNGFDNPLHINQRQEDSNAGSPPESLPMRPHVATDTKSSPLVVNGSTQSPVFSPTSAGQMASFGQRIAASHAIGGVAPYSVAFNDGFQVQGKGKASDMKWQRGVPSRQQQAGIAPLDLAINNPMFTDAQHLSPVYEHRTPSPTVFRQVAESFDGSRQPQTAKSLYGSGDRNGTIKGNENPRSNGQTSGSRSSKGEGENAGGWKAAKSRKKQQTDNKGAGKVYTQSEQPPKNESERKGG